MYRVTAFMVVVLAVAGVVKAQKPSESSKDNSRPEETKVQDQFFAAQAALLSALADAEALERITNRPGLQDYDLSRTLIGSINRSIAGADTGTVKMGKSRHALEKDENIKTMRSELAEALKANDAAHAAADGHGRIGPHAKNQTAHLLYALTSLVKVSEKIGVKPLQPPGLEALVGDSSRQK